MATSIVQATATQTPDAGLGGLAVTGITNTGHASTSTSSSADAPPPSGSASDSDSKSARWFGLPNVSGQRTSVRLKFSWNISGSCNAHGGLGGSDPQINGVASSSCSFSLQYSLNGGSSWTTHVNDFASSFSFGSGSDNDGFNNVNSANIALSNNQDVSQIQVRVSYSTSCSADAGNGFEDATSDASVTATISGIQVDVVTQDQTHTLVMM
jgi:hypothetical protein